MPSHCCVPCCNANYRTGPRVSVFSFPKDSELIKKWLTAIPRKNLVPTDSSKVCQKHFKPEDIVTEVSAFDPKKQVTITVQLKNHRLKADAVPSIFEDIPTKRCKKVKNTSLKENKEKDKIDTSVKTSMQSKSLKRRLSSVSDAGNSPCRQDGERKGSIKSPKKVSSTTVCPIIAVIKAEDLIMEEDKKPEKINIDDSGDDDDDEEEDDNNEENDDDNDEDDNKDDDSEIEIDVPSSQPPSVTLPTPHKTMPNVPVHAKEDRVPISQGLKTVKRSPSTGSSSSTGSSEAQKLNPSVVVKRRKIEKPAPVVIGRQNDCYCWVCHRENIILCCIACPRAYHPKCAGESSLPNSDWVCPECQKILAAENVDSRSSTLAEISIEKLGALLKLSLNKMKQRAPIAFHQPVSLEHYPLYPHYVIHPMDFSLLEKNIKQKVYGCTEAFLADVKWISHNSCVFNGTQHPLSTNAKNLVKACDQDMQEIEVCPDCFVHSVVRNKYWFSEVCRKPHPLVWAKLKGFPYWPAKVVRVLDGNVDARFFGAHDRAWVPVSQCYHLSKEMPTTSKPKKKGNYEVALDELNVHVHILIQKFGCFDYAPYRTAFNPENKFLTFHGIDIDKISKEEITFDVSSPIPEKFLSSEKENRFASFLESEQEKLNSDEGKISDSLSEKQHSNSPLKLTDVLKSPFLFSERKSTDSQLSEKETNENETNSEKCTLEGKTNDQNKTMDIEKKDLCQVSPIKISDKVSASDQFRKLELALERIKGYVSSSVDTEKENDESQDDDKNKNKGEEDKEISDQAKEKINKTKPSSPLFKESITLPVIESDSIQETVEDVTKSLQTTKKTDSFFLKLNETIASCKAKLGISEDIDDLSDESGADENASRSDDDEVENTSSSEAEEESSDEEVEDEQSDIVEISDEEAEAGNEEIDLENKSEETDEESSKSDEESDSDCTDTEIESHGTDASPKKDDKSSVISDKESKSDEKEDYCADKHSDLSLKGDLVSYRFVGEMASASSEAKILNDVQTPEVTVDDSGALEVVGENSSSESSIGGKLKSLNEQFNQTTSSEITASPVKNIACNAAGQQMMGLVSDAYSKDRITDATAEGSISKNVSPVTELHHTSENNNQINLIVDKNSYYKANNESENEAVEKDDVPADTQIKSVCDGEIPENSMSLSTKNESVEDDDDIFICTPTRPKSPPVIILDDDAENEDSSVSDTYAVKTPPYSTSVESFSNEDNPPRRNDSGDEQSRFSPSKAINIKRRASSEVSEEMNGISNSVDLNNRRKRRKLSSEESSEDEIQIVTPVKRVGLTGAKRTFHKPNPVEAAKRVSPTLESVKRNLVKEALVAAGRTTPPSKTSKIDTDFMRPESTSPTQSPQSILRTPMVDTRNLNEHEKEILFLKRKLSCLMTAYKIQGWKCNQEREELRHNMNLIVMEMRACLEADKKQAIDILVRKLEQEKLKSVEEAKRKQWCATCLSESRYACCWNTSYCSVECQKKDFNEHRKTCSQIKKRDKQNLLRKIFPAPSTTSTSEDNKAQKVIILNMKTDAVKPADQAVSVTSQQNPVSKPEIQFTSPTNTQQNPSPASSSKPVQVLFTHGKPSPETNVSNVTTSKPSTSNIVENNLDSTEIISNVRNKACDLGTAITLLKKKNLESTLSILSKKLELKEKEGSKDTLKDEKDASKDEANLEDVYFPSPPKITFEGYDAVSPDSNITINENEETLSNCDTETELPALQEGLIPERDIDLSDTDDMDNSMVNIGHSVEVKAKFLNKCLVYGQTASKLTRCLVDIIFPDLRLLASCSAFGQKSNVTKLTRAALPARKVYAIIDYVTKRFPYALRSEIVLAINMKCKEARFMLRKQEEDSRIITSRRLLAKEQEDDIASSTTPTAVETVSSAAAAIPISSPTVSSLITPKTHPNVVCVKSSTTPFNMPKKTSNVPNILRCSPQFLMPKPMYGPVSSNTAFLQTPPLGRKRETVKELLLRNNLSKGNVGIERKDGPNIVMAVDAHKHTARSPLPMSAPSSSNMRPFLIIGTPSNASKQPSPLQNPLAQPHSSKM